MHSDNKLSFIKEEEEETSKNFKHIILYSFLFKAKKDTFTHIS